MGQVAVQMAGRAPANGQHTANILNALHAVQSVPHESCCVLQRTHNRPVLRVQCLLAAGTGRPRVLQGLHKIPANEKMSTVNTARDSPFTENPL
jgi:hypothetical protein